MTGIPVRQLKGIGPEREKQLNKAEIYTVLDLAEYYPRAYEDRTRVIRLDDIENNDTCTVYAEVISPVRKRTVRKNLTLYQVVFQEAANQLVATWYNQNHLMRVFRPGERYALFGKIEKKGRGFEMQNPLYEKTGTGTSVSMAVVAPVYPLTAGLTQTTIRAGVQQALQVCPPEEFLPDWLRTDFGLGDRPSAVMSVHFPDSIRAIEPARQRLAFDEIFLTQATLMSLKKLRTEKEDGELLRWERGSLERLLRQLPYSPTGAQSRVIESIISDLTSGKLMNRLVQGDVGSGKTLIAFAACFLASCAGRQSALLAPTGILAEQHYRSAKILLEPLGVRIELLTGGTRKSERKRILELLENGTVSLIIGTHALLEEPVQFSALSLVVTDEQHRFGVRQRTVLRKKGQSPHLLVMTATPIPRTLSLVLFGDLDVSVIDELPPGRTPVETFAVGENMRSRTDAFLRKQIEDGRQVFVVCPLVEESESIEAQSATESWERISGTFFDKRVGLLHGRMKASEKDDIMRAFAAHELDILVSTTVIEVGVNVPNATVMVIENAERFGLAQLHQLRGRVGRGAHASYCILFCQSKSEISRERMKIMSSTNDGFLIAEKDLEIRGPGDVFGVRQHGIPEFRVANLYQDTALAEISREAVRLLYEKDPELVLPEHAGMKSRMQIILERAEREFALN